MGFLWYNKFAKERSGRTLIVQYASKDIEEVCTNATKAKRKYGTANAQKIFVRLRQLAAVLSVEELLKIHSGRCHALEGNRKGQYALDLVHPLRMIFRKVQKDGKTICIIEIVDYH